MNSTKWQEKENRSKVGIYEQISVKKKSFQVKFFYENK